MNVDSLDHLVLTVRSISTTVDFYQRVLGMEARTFEDGRVALHFGAQKLNLHEAAHVIDPHVRHATPGSADLCFLTRVPLPAVMRHLTACGVRVIEGPGLRTGARGPLHSVYFYDPDENLIEIANQVCDKPGRPERR
jgi:catechol 2,3-dioxygenase-like lactoylglutathione lyase family enzyme